MKNEKKKKLNTAAVGDAIKITQHCRHVGSSNKSRLKQCQIGKDMSMVKDREKQEKSKIHSTLKKRKHKL